MIGIFVGIPALLLCACAAGAYGVSPFIAVPVAAVLGIALSLVIVLEMLPSEDRRRFFTKEGQRSARDWRD